MPYNLQQNEVAKQSISLICYIARTIILDFKLLLYLQLKAINIAVKILNRLLINVLAKEVPYTL